MSHLRPLRLRQCELQLPSLPLLPLGPARVEQVPRLNQAVANGATQRVVAVEHAPSRLQYYGNEQLVLFEVWVFPLKWENQLGFPT